MSKKNRNDEVEELDELLDNELQEDEAIEEGGDEMEIEGEDEEEEHPKKKRHRLMRSLMNNEGENNITSIKDLYKSIRLNGDWFKRNILFILTITACLIALVTNRYQAQQEQIEEAELKKQLTEMKYKWLTRFSELTTSTRQSQIEERLRQVGDTTLTHSKDAPFIIRANK